MYGLAVGSRPHSSSIHRQAALASFCLLSASVHFAQHTVGCVVYGWAICLYLRCLIVVARARHIVDCVRACVSNANNETCRMKMFAYLGFPRFELF